LGFSWFQIGFVAKVKANPAWLSGWGYRQSHVVENATGAGTNYQMYFNVYRGTGTSSGNKVYLQNHNASTFPNDLNFTDNDEVTPLDYWVEDSNSSWAGVWVEVTDNLNTTDQTIYVYYGKSDATTTSNGVNTFPFFDHFLGSSLNTSKWGESGVVSVSNSEVNLDNDDGIKSLTTFGLSYSVIAKAKADEQDVLFIAFSNGYIPNPDPLTVVQIYQSDYDANNNFDCFSCRAATSSGSSTSQLIDDQLDFRDTYYNYEINRVLNKAKFYQAGSLMTTITTYVPTTSLPVSCCVWDSSQESTLTVDWVLVRKYVDPEPSYGSWGGEESFAVENSVSNPDPNSSSTKVQWQVDFKCKVTYYDTADNVTIKIFNATDNTQAGSDIVNNTVTNATQVKYGSYAFSAEQDYKWMATYYNTSGDATTGGNWTFTIDVPPRYQNVDSNATSIQEDGTILLYGQGYDGIGLDWAWLWTNETGGTGKNYTETETIESISTFGDWLRNRACYIIGNYAYVTSQTELHIINITDKSNPVILSNLTLGSQMLDINVNGDYAYISDGTGYALYVVNISDPVNPSTMDFVSHDTYLHANHGIYYLNNYVYCCAYSGGTTGTFTIVNVTNPSDISIVGHITDSDKLKGIHDVYVKDNYAYVSAHYSATTNCGTFNVINVTDKTNPTIISHLAHLQLQGAADVQVKGNYAYVHGRTVAEPKTYYIHTIDISDVENPTFAGNITGYGMYVGAIYENYLITAQEGVVDDNYVNMFDISTPTSLQLVTREPIGSGSKTIHIFLTEDGEYAIVAKHVTSGTDVYYILKINLKHYFSPKDMNDATDTWAWSNFTWCNTSITSGTTIQWRIYYNDTYGNVNGTSIHSFTVGVAPEYDYVDLDTSNVDSSDDVGTHSNFENEKACDSSFDTLTEADTGTPSDVFTDGFEDQTFNKWDGNGATSWLISDAYAHDSTYSAESESTHMGDLISDDIDLSGASSVGFEFWTYATSVDASEFLLYFYNGTEYNLIKDLDVGDDVWNYHSETIASQYFVSNFRIKVYTTGLGVPQDVYVDDVKVNKTTSNYKLDLEIQWTDANYTRTNEQLCIKTGTFGASEDIKVYAWNVSTSDWHLVFSDLAPSTWNNISVSDWLNNETFTVRFLGGTETGDTTQDTWNIDCALLHTWEVTGESYFIDLTQSSSTVWSTITQSVFNNILTQSVSNSWNVLEQWNAINDLSQTLTPSYTVITSHGTFVDMTQGISTVWAVLTQWNAVIDVAQSLSTAWTVLFQSMFNVNPSQTVATSWQTIIQSTFNVASSLSNVFTWLVNVIHTVGAQQYIIDLSQVVSTSWTVLVSSSFITSLSQSVSTVWTVLTQWNLNVDVTQGLATTWTVLVQTSFNIATSLSNTFTWLVDVVFTYAGINYIIDLTQSVSTAWNILVSWNINIDIAQSLVTVWTVLTSWNTNININQALTTTWTVLTQVDFNLVSSLSNTFTWLVDAYHWIFTGYLYNVDLSLQIITSWLVDVAVLPIETDVSTIGLAIVALAIALSALVFALKKNKDKYEEEL